MVSRREPAALGLRALLAQGRQADLARRRADRPRQSRKTRRRHSRRRRGASSRPSPRRLGVGPRLSSCPAYEDPRALAAQGRPSCRSMSTPGDSEDGRSRKSAPACRASSSAGSRRPTGYVLPVQRWNARRRATRWISERWPFRRGKLFLMPAIRRSAIVCRWPRCPVSRRRSYPYIVEQDPTGGARPLPSADAFRAKSSAPQTPPTASSRTEQVAGRERRRAHGAWPSSRATARSACVHAAGRTARGLSRTARGGRDQRRATGLPVHIEGYPPPLDPRLDVIKVDARPRRHRGQHPSGRQLATRRSRSPTSALRGARGSARLGADKFMIDGRHTGTGGGNHVVVGGATPADSPFLRRPGPAEEPDPLLAAPSLAVLSVLRPVRRPDQPGAARRRGAARRALRTGDRAGDDAAPRRDGEMPPPWLVDRLYRNLLIDVTGNTHRAEICIDKLYSPDGPTGRLGLVEFRAFEMPPDARMSLAQQLLLRALVAWFWREPQEGGLVRWGTACTTASCCRISSGRISSTCSTICAAPATTSTPTGSRRSASSASRSTARSSMAA